jgi:hypothetical protein
MSFWERFVFFVGYAILLVPIAIVLVLVNDLPVRAVGVLLLMFCSVAAYRHLTELAKDPGDDDDSARGR